MPANWADAEWDTFLPVFSPLPPLILTPSLSPLCAVVWNEICCKKWVSGKKLSSKYVRPYIHTRAAGFQFMAVPLYYANLKINVQKKTTSTSSSLGWALEIKLLICIPNNISHLFLFSILLHCKNYECGGILAKYLEGYIFMHQKYRHNKIRLYAFNPKPNIPNH